MDLPNYSSNELFLQNSSYERYRLTTFIDNWPHAYVSPGILAKVGFHFIGSHDQVMCHFCKVKVRSWKMGDNEVAEHFRWSPNCPLLLQQFTENVPIGPVLELNKLLAPVKASMDLIERSIGAYAETPIEFFNMNTNPDFPGFGSEIARLRTFKDWPKAMAQNPWQMAEAGFFCTQKEDRVICFSCGGGLCKCKNGDNPWEQHAYWYGGCKHLLSKMGKAYVEGVKRRFFFNR